MITIISTWPDFIQLRVFIDTIYLALARQGLE